MNPFNKRTAVRIAAVSILLASIASPVGWFVARESAEESIVALATEESGRLLHYFNAIDMRGPDAAFRAAIAAKTISGGLFDIAEIYDANGRKLAESMTGEGKKNRIVSTPSWCAKLHRFLVSKLETFRAALGFACFCPFAQFGDGCERAHHRLFRGGTRRTGMANGANPRQFLDRGIDGLPGILALRRGDLSRCDSSDSRQRT